MPAGLDRDAVLELLRRPRRLDLALLCLRFALAAGFVYLMLGFFSDLPMAAEMPFSVRPWTASFPSSADYILGGSIAVLAGAFAPLCLRAARVAQRRRIETLFDCSGIAQGLWHDRLTWLVSGAHGPELRRSNSSRRGPVLDSLSRAYERRARAHGYPAFALRWPYLLGQVFSLGSCALFIAVSCLEAKGRLPTGGEWFWISALALLLAWLLQGTLAPVCILSANEAVADALADRIEAGSALPVCAEEMALAEQTPAAGNDGGW